MFFLQKSGVFTISFILPTFTAWKINQLDKHSSYLFCKFAQKSPFDRDLLIVLMKNKKNKGIHNRSGLNIPSNGDGRTFFVLTPFFCVFMQTIYLV